MPKPKPHFNLPRQFDSAMLMKQAIPGETIIVLQYKDAYNQSAFQFSDKNGRVGIMHFDAKLNCHALRVPASLWNADRGAMAHAFMQTGSGNRLVVTTETPVFKSQCGQAVKSPDSYSGIVGSTPTTATTSPEMGATEQGQDALNVVVGRGAPDASTVAPASVTLSSSFSEQEQQRKDLRAELDAGIINDAWLALEKPVRLKALAAMLKVDEETLKDCIALPISTVELGHAGWVKRREPQA